MKESIMSDNLYSVYIISNCINDKVYIGMSKDPKTRWYYHKYPKNKRISLIQRAINKYGEDNFQFDIVESNLSFTEAIQREMRLIALYNTTDYKFGYNITKGGGCFSGLFGKDNPMFGKKRPDLAERNRLGKGKIQTEEARINMSLAGKGRIHSEEAKLKMSQAKKEQWVNGIYSSEEYRKKQSFSKKGKSQNGKKIKCNETGHEYKSITQAVNDLKISRYNLFYHLKGEVKNVSGFTFILI